MDVLTIILSGPGGFESQARKALLDAGFVVHDKTVGHGLADTTAGDVDASQSFISVEGEDVDAAAAAVAPLNWVLRAHHPPPMITAPLIEDQQTAHEELVRRLVREEMAKDRAAS